MEHQLKPEEENIEQNVSFTPQIGNHAQKGWNDLVAEQSSPSTPELSGKRLELSHYSLIGIGTLVVGGCFIPRDPEFTPGRAENDTEHTQMLGEVAQDLAEDYMPHLNIAKIRSMADLHDKIEIFTGDVSTFRITKEQREAKKQAEEDAMPKLMAVLSPRRQAVLKEYEEQLVIEARFVRLADKIMPYLVDIIGEGVKVLVEKQGVETFEEYCEIDGENSMDLKKEYPEPELEFLHRLRDLASYDVAMKLRAAFEDEEESEEVKKEKEFDEYKDVMEEPGIDPSGNC